MLAPVVHFTTFVVKMQKDINCLFMKKLRQKKVKPFVQEKSLGSRNSAKHQEDATKFLTGSLGADCEDTKY